MKNVKKRVAAILLVLCMALSLLALLPVGARASDGETAEDITLSSQVSDEGSAAENVTGTESGTAEEETSADAEVIKPEGFAIVVVGVLAILVATAIAVSVTFKRKK